MKNNIFFLGFIFAALFALFGQPARLYAENLPQVDQAPFSKGPKFFLLNKEVPAENEQKWTFSAESINTDHSAEYIESQGNCIFSNGVDSLRADFARYYKKSGWVLLRGNVRAVWQGDFLEAQEAEFELNSMQGWLKNGKIFVAKPHIYLESAYIQRNKGNSYSFTNAKVTSCGGQKPAWSLVAEEGDVTLDGDAKLWHSSFQVRDVPVAYLPYMQLPAGKKRRSGFLMPDLLSSSSLGVGFNLPFYWAVNDNVDLTFYQNFMASRGYRQGIEFRHALRAKTKGFWQFDYLNDKKTYKNKSEESSLVDGDEFLRPNRNRWWLRSKVNSTLGATAAWKMIFDVDLASDQDYLKEFSQGLLGYEQSRKEMLEQFGRDINPADDVRRTSTLMLARDYEKIALSAKIEYTENLAYMNDNNESSDNTTLQKLPELGLYVFKDTMGDCPLEFESAVQYGYFSRKKGSTGHRVSLKPQMSLPLSTSWLTLIPSVGMTGHWYYVDNWETESEVVLSDGYVEGNHTGDDRSPSTFVPNTGITLFSEISRVFDMAHPDLEVSKETVGQGHWNAVKHSIIPRVSYFYEPRQTGLNNRPYFESTDRFNGLNKITYSVSNVFDRKREFVTLKEQDMPALSTDYLDFLRLRLEQSYDYQEASREDERETYDRHPFSDAMAELILKPSSRLSVVSKSCYSPYLSKLVEHESDLNYYFLENSKCSLGYDFLEKRDEYLIQQDERIHALALGGDFGLSEHMQFALQYRRDLEDARDLEKSAAFLWLEDCYSIKVEYARFSSGDNFALNFGLKF